MIAQLALFGAVAFVVTLALTPLVRRLAIAKGIVDRASDDPARKYHVGAIPLLGGVGMIVAAIVTVLLVRVFNPSLLDTVPTPTLVGLLLASVVLLVGGVLDDRYHLSPGQQIVWPVAAALVAIVSGVGIPFVTNPFGGLLYLDQWSATLGQVGSWPIIVTLWADIFALAWLLGATYTTKFLDGLDGLVTGITAIGGVLLVAVSLRPEVNQSGTALLAAILTGVCFAFLVWNFHPAKMFLGEAGSLWTGFMLGVLAIISGGKIATALLILGIPILDVMVVILGRLWRHQSPFRTADRTHLHFRLLDAGFSHRAAVLTLYAVTAVFGTLTLMLHGQQKLYALIIATILMVVSSLVWLRPKTNA